MPKGVTKNTKKNPFFKPGQTKETPPAHDAVRKFYTSLLKQNRSSTMALKYCMEHGILSEKKLDYAVAYFGLSKLKI